MFLHIPLKVYMANLREDLDTMSLITEKSSSQPYRVVYLVTEHMLKILLTITNFIMN